jgi:ferrous iron transport protein B
MSPLATESRVRSVALVGNPNTGKSTLFTALSGVHQRVGNYPGVTVEKKVGTFTHGRARWSVVDLPGTYSLAPRSPDEMVAVDVLLGRRPDTPPPDVILAVVDASSLRRNLYLLSQLLELGRPVVVALTMNDVARARGLTVDAAGLAARLGVPVVPVHAKSGHGLETLRQTLESAAETPPAPDLSSPFPDAFRLEARRLADTLALPPYLAGRLLLDADGALETLLLDPGDLGDVPIDQAAARDALRAARARLADAGFAAADFEAEARHDWAGRLAAAVVDQSHARPVTASDRLDKILTHPLAGTLILAAILLLLFQAVFTWAQAPMEWIENGVATLAGLVESTLLAEGVIGGLGAVIVFLPQILILFFFLGLLEDCGYLARAAYLMDAWMARVGLSGKSFIPLLSSFACAIPGIMATRVIEDRRDRLTTILIAPLMSCSARLPVYTLLIAAFVPDRRVLGLFGAQGLTLLAMYVVGIAAAAAVALLLKRTALRGDAPAFVMELPGYKWPAWRVVAWRMVERAGVFLQGAGTTILAVSVLMWAALYYPRLPAATAAAHATVEAELEQAVAQAEASGEPAAVEAAESTLADARAAHAGAQRRQSWLGRAGRWIEPAVKPLGWDWRIGTAALASFPAREVVVAGLGVLFDVGADADESSGRLRETLQRATWPDTGRPLFTLPVALSLMVFFALCMQCAATLAVMRRETNGWRWPLFSFTYMTALAYLAALVTYQLATRLTAA